MTLLLVRHGQTAANASGLLLGRLDAPLSETGAAEADAVAGHVARTARVARVVTSPLLRARDTAGAIAAACGAMVVVDERLVELDYGDWDGRPLAELPPDVVARWRADPGFRPPGGEALRDVHARVEPFVREFLDAEGDTVAVSHVSPIKAAICWALGVGDEVAWRMFLRTASVSRLRSGYDGAPHLISFNEPPS